MFVTEGVRDLVLKETGEAAEAEARGRGNRDDDDLAVNLDCPHVRATSRAGRSGNHDDASTGVDAHGRKPPGEKRPEVFRVIARAVFDAQAC